MKLISVEELKQYTEQEGASQDDLLGSIIEGISKRFETFLNRKLEQAEITEYFRGGRRNFYLERYPVATAESVALTIEDVAKTRDTDYWMDYDRGVVEFVDQVAKGDPKSIAVTYTGGYSDTKGVLDVPDDLKLACKMQCAFTFRRKRTLGVKGVTAPDGSMTINAPDELLKEVKETLKSYRRILI